MPSNSCEQVNCASYRLMWRFVREREWQKSATSFFGLTWPRPSRRAQVASLCLVTFVWALFWCVSAYQTLNCLFGSNGRRITVFTLYDARLALKCTLCLGAIKMANCKHNPLILARQSITIFFLCFFAARTFCTRPCPFMYNLLVRSSDTSWSLFKLQSVVQSDLIASVVKNLEEGSFPNECVACEATICRILLY